MKAERICPHCGKPIARYRNPLPTVDIIIEWRPGGEDPEAEPPQVVLIRRKNPPYGWALPGGFVDYGESLEAAAVREAREETSLEVSLKYLLGVYSDPDRDPRHHTLSAVYVACARGEPRAADDAGEIGLYTRETLPGPLAFDHAAILEDYFRLRSGESPGGIPSVAACSSSSRNAGST